MASVQVVETIEFPGTCDASAAVALEDGRVAVANDEDNIIRIYTLAGKEVEEVPLTGLGLEEEADLEGAARRGTKTYWITSHGRNKDGKPRSERRQFLAAELAGAGRRLDPGITARGLLEAMLEDGTLAPLLKDAALKAPEAPGGLNIEGLAIAPDGGVLIGFRNPIPSGLALVVPLENPDETLLGERPRFGSPIMLDLRGLGIRSLEHVGRDYLILAGSQADGGSFKLFRWDGTRVRLLEDLSTLLAFSGLTPEALVEIRAGRLLVLSDDGSRRVGDRPCKKAPAGKKTFRGVVLELGEDAR